MKSFTKKSLALNFYDLYNLQFKKRLIHMTKYIWLKLVLEHDQKFFTTMNQNNWTWPKNMTTTNINFTQKNMVVWFAWTGPPAPACKLALYKKKTSGTEVMRTPDARLRFVSFNFGHVQLLILVVVVIRSYSFCHLDSVMKVFLFKSGKI